MVVRSRAAKVFDIKEAVVASIPIADIVIDENYQGTVNNKLVDEIAKHWDTASAGAIVLNMREDNTYAALDGQHRVLAAKKAGVLELNALVFIGKTKQEEARLFVALNFKHNVSSVSRFRANLYAGNRREREIMLAIKEVGLEFGTSSRGKNTPADRIACAAALVHVYEHYGIAHVKTVLGALTSAYHEFNDRRKAYSQVAILGAAQFFYRYPQADMKRIIAKMATKAPTTMLAMGDAKLGPHSDLWLGWGKVMVELYNEGLKRSLQLDPSIMDKNVYTPAGLKKMSSEESRKKKSAASKNISEEQKQRRNAALIKAREAYNRNREMRQQAKKRAEILLNVKQPLRGRQLAAAAKAGLADKVQ